MNPIAEIAGGVTVPFRPASSSVPLLLVDVWVNGQGPFQFVVDTGASATGFSQRLAERLRLSDGEQQTALGCGGAIAGKMVQVSELRVGPLRIQSLPVFVADLSPIAGKVGAEIDGILGYDFLHRWRVVIDYPCQTLTFSQ